MADTRSGFGARRMDFISLLGLIVSVGGILAGLLMEGGHLSDVAQVSAAVIVFGGTVGAVMLTTPRAVALSALRRIKTLPFEHRVVAAEVIEEVIALSMKARKGGLVVLEDDLGSISDPFLFKALKLAVDGTELKHIRVMMELEMRLEFTEADTDARVFESAGGYAPTIGILGAVIGLIQVMKHLDDMTKVGYGIAVAFVATIYGVGAANLLFLPIGQKIRLRAQQVLQSRQLMMEGVASITEGMNPTLIRRKLEAFVRDPRARTARAFAVTSRPRKVASA